jgi:hypothetical protein
MLSGRGADHSPPSEFEVKNEWSYTLHSPTSLHGVHWHVFTFNSGTPYKAVPNF